MRLQRRHWRIALSALPRPRLVVFPFQVARFEVENSRKAALGGLVHQENLRQIREVSAGEPSGYSPKGKGLT